MSALHLPPLKLYHYWRSSSSWRVRWAFALKGMLEHCELVSINLLSDEAESPTHRARNPMGYVPTLEIGAGPSCRPPFLAQSMAIIECANDIAPDPTLLPGDPFARACVRQLAEVINSGTQPIQNPNVRAFHS